MKKIIAFLAMTILVLPVVINQKMQLEILLLQKA